MALFLLKSEAEKKEVKESEVVDMDAPLDFESEDPLLSSPSSVTDKRKKVIGLDDLLTDYYKEKNELIEKESKRAKAKKNYNSDEDDYRKEAKVSEVVDHCQNKMKQLGGEEDISVWGIQVFGQQKTPPTLVCPEVKSCTLLQSFRDTELNSLVELTAERGESFLEGLLINDWLSKLVFTSGTVEKSIAIWTCNLMLYSSREELRTSACDFWCDILSLKNEVNKVPLKINWFPNYSELRKALEIYGYSSTFLLTSERCYDSSCGGPPQNIRSWIKLVTICCKKRGERSRFSISEARELVEVIICLFLDGQFQGLMMLLYECLQSLLNYFTDEEWNECCETIAKSLACRVPRDLNCLRAVECISGPDARSKRLRSKVAYHILLLCFDNKAADEEEVLRLLISVSVKDKSCDLFKVYIYLVLTENWLLPGQIAEDKQLIGEMWGLFLRNCSCQISSTDLRSYASKVRNKASYILQGSIK